MNYIKKGFHICKDVIEIYIPSILFIILFVSFLAGVIFRYVFKNPQSWTFELSTVSFVMSCLLSCSIAYRKNDHVVFDLIYSVLSPFWQTIFRVVGNLAIVVFISLIVPASVKYLVSMQEQKLYTQILNIPRWIVFSPLVILFVISVLRSIYRFVLDIRSLVQKTYVAEYEEADKEVLL